MRGATPCSTAASGPRHRSCSVWLPATTERETPSDLNLDSGHHAGSTARDARAVHAIDRLSDESADDAHARSTTGPAKPCPARQAAIKISMRHASELRANGRHAPRGARATSGVCSSRTPRRIDRTPPCSGGRAGWRPGRACRCRPVRASRRMARITSEVSAALIRRTPRTRFLVDYWRGETIVLGIAGPVAIHSGSAKDELGAAPAASTSARISGCSAAPPSMPETGHGLSRVAHRARGAAQPYICPFSYGTIFSRVTSRPAIRRRAGASRCLPRSPDDCAATESGVQATG